MNPFTENSINGSKKGFYFDQLENINEGVENAKVVKIKDGDDLVSARMYINKYFSGIGEKYKTKINDGQLWVVRIGKENKK